MAKLYYRKIRDKEINLDTGEIWCIDDVPERWKEGTLALLEGNQD